MAYALAVLSGMLYVLGYAGFGIWPLAFVAFVPLLYAVDAHVRDGAQALRVGLVAGAVLHAFGFHFLLPTLQVFSGQPLWICVPVFALFFTYQGGVLALFAWLLFRARRRGRSVLWVSPLAYGAVDWLYPQLFPSSLSGSAYALTPLVQIADLGGPVLLSMLLVASSSACYGLLRPMLGSGRLAARFAGMTAVVVAGVLLYGALRVEQVQAAIARAPKLRIAAVQVDLGQWQKREDREEGRRRHLAQSRALERAPRPPGLIVWPETALHFVLPTSVKSVRELLPELTTPVLFGGLAHRVVNGRAELYNSAFLADATGRVLGRSDKVKLIPFAEYMPLGERFPRLYELSRASGRFERAARPRALSLGGHRIAALICYEDVLFEYVRDAMRATDPHLLVNLTNDAWFGDSQEPHIHLALSTLRAVEHRRFLVRATGTGVSAIVDPLGRVIAQSGVFRRENVSAEIAWLNERTPYTRAGDVAGYLSVVGALLASFVRRTGAV